MTRSASPNGQVEFSYDFPVASTSRLAPTSTRVSHTQKLRTRSPQCPRWESITHHYYNDDDAVVDDDKIDYDAYGSASVATRTRRAHIHPAPIPTHNQWRAPSPPLYPFGHTTTTSMSPYFYSAPLLLAPPTPRHTQVSSSYESTCSVLSACSRASEEKEERTHHAKICKPRRSVDSDAPRSLAAPASFSSPYITLPASSPSSSPCLFTYDDFDVDEGDRHLSHFTNEEEQHEQEEQHERHAPSRLHRQWAALSLRVRLGVFRTKRMMRHVARRLA